MVDERFDELLHTLCADYRVHNNLNLEARTNSNIKRGLRNDDGTGVMVGCTAVGNVLGYTIEDGERVPMPGRLIYRGYDLSDLVDGYIREQRFGFPEGAFLLLFGHLPDQEQYDMFKRLLHDFTDLPQNFTEDMILKNPSHNVMNKLGRSVLALYSCDPDPDSLSVENMMRQSIELIARFPVIAAYAYVVKRHYFDNDSLYLHRPEPELSTAENFLRMIRPDKRFTHEEARLLDLCLVCHAEHGGGNNSTFTCRSVSSTGTDTYSAIAAAMVRERTRVAFFIVSPSFFHVCSAFFSQISPDQTKSAQPRRQAGAARLCAKAKSLLFFLCFCLRNQNGVRSFCTADPVVPAPCLDCSDYSILPKFCKHFLSASSGFLPPIALFY